MIHYVVKLSFFGLISKLAKKTAQFGQSMLRPTNMFQKDLFITIIIITNFAAQKLSKQSISHI